MTFADRAPATHAQTTEPSPPAAQATLEQVEIKSAGDLAQRREFVAGKIIIGRKSIEDGGATSVDELLKREPSVTVSANGRLGLLGLPGYTQVLLDGVAPPPGRNPLEMDLVHVERIEIVKAALAEFGPYGIAGTINIVTRKLERKKIETLRIGATGGPANAESNVAWSNTLTRPGDPLVTTHRVSMRHKLDESQGDNTLAYGSASQPGEPISQSRERGTQTFSSITASGTMRWIFDKSNDLDFSPAVFAWQQDARKAEGFTWFGSANGPLQSSMRSEATLVTMSVPLSWRHKLESGSRLDVLLSPTRSSIRREQTRESSFASSATEQRQQSRQELQDVAFMKLDYTADLGTVHELKAGANLGHSRRRSDFSAWLNDAPDLDLIAFGTRQTIMARHTNLYIQDEWQLGKRLALNLGLSYERRLTRIDEGEFVSEGSYSLWAPSAHLAWKLDDRGRSKLRLALARNFNAPDNDQLTKRPTINPLAPCPAQGACGANTIEFADTSGNPALKPERSSGLTLSYEHYLGAESLVNMDAYARRLIDVIGTDLRLENVPWANAPRYVATPANLGDAWTRGLSLEARLQLQEWSPAWPKMELRGGVNVARSRLSTLPEPDNHLANQTPWSAKLGGRYKFSGSTGLEFGLDANWLPANWIRSNFARRYYTSRRVDMNAQVNWALGPTARMRLNASNLLPGHPLTIEEFGSPARPGVTSNNHKSASPKLGLVLELRL